MSNLILKLKKSIPAEIARRVYHDFKYWDKTKDRLQIEKTIKRYKDRHKGEVCVVVGNGPSLRIEDLTRLYELNIPTFACNRVTLAFPETLWRPTYYFISDEKLLTGYSDDVDGVPAENRFFPKAFREKGIKNGVFYGPSPEFYDYEKEGKFSTDASKGVCGGGTVTVEMMQFAYYMGFQEIYLIGVDFSYAINSPLNGKTYAYQGENNYFIKDYLKQGEVAAIPNLTANLLAFHAAKTAFESSGRTVNNATRGGKLEVFERIDLDVLFERWEKEKHESCRFCSDKTK